MLSTDTVSLSPNPLVQALGKPAQEFTKADIIGYIEDNRIDHARTHDGGDRVDFFLADERACGWNEWLHHWWSSWVWACVSAVFGDEAWVSSGVRVPFRSM